MSPSRHQREDARDHAGSKIWRNYNSIHKRWKGGAWSASTKRAEEMKGRKKVLSPSPEACSVLFLLSTISLSIITSSVPVGASIDCFKCVSLNGSNPYCDDPFHNNYSESTYESPCMGGRKGRDGLWPATACLKLAGIYVESGETITVRGCALDSGTLNTDTEIIRMSHCGHFWFEDRYVRGCLKSCDDADGCNAGSRLHLLFPILEVVLIVLSIYQKLFV